MIKTISKSELPACLKIFHRGYETVAVEFGLTEENSPDRGRASLPIEKLISEFENGVAMFGYLRQWGRFSLSLFYTITLCVLRSLLRA